MLGVVDASASWYAGLAFAPAERLESVTATTNEADALLRAATRQAALSLSWAGMAATAHVEEGNPERTIIRVARDMAADWVVLARSVDANQTAASLVDRLIADAEASILIAPTIRINEYEMDQRQPGLEARRAASMAPDGQATQPLPGDWPRGPFDVRLWLIEIAKTTSDPQTDASDAIRGDPVIERSDCET